MQDKRTERWFSQKWVFDAALRAIGVEPFTGGSLTRGYEAIGIDVLEESHELSARVKKFSDITRECKRLASKRENHAQEAEAEGHRVTARDNYFVASVMYGCARWPIWDDENPQLIELTNKSTKCFLKYASLSDHDIERIELPFEGKKLYAYLHLPPDRVLPLNSDRISAGGKELAYPCVVVIPGMDTFKEELVRLYSDKFLQRGFAVLVVDGPGQGESLAMGLKLTTDNFDRAGKAVMDHLFKHRVLSKTEATVDRQHIGLFAASFGTYWGPRIMAYDSRYNAGTFSNICHEPHMKTIFNGTLPSFKARHMWMTGIYDEDEFDNKYCSGLTLDGVGEKITNQPIFFAAGSDDPLSPIEYTYEFFKTIASPKKTLLVYEGEEHRISDPFLPGRIGDFMESAMKNVGTKYGSYFLEKGSSWRSMVPLVIPPG